MEALLSILRGIRNGAYYGTKIRAPHGTFSRRMELSTSADTSVLT